MKNWIEIIRDADYVNLLVTNHKKKLGSSKGGNVEVRMPCRKDAIIAKYDNLYHVDTVPDGIDGPPPK